MAVDGKASCRGVLTAMELQASSVAGGKADDRSVPAGVEPLQRAAAGDHVRIGLI